MSAETRSDVTSGAAPSRSGSKDGFALLVGVAAGVLIAALVIPASQDASVTSAASDGRDGIARDGQVAEDGPSTRTDRGAGVDGPDSGLTEEDPSGQAGAGADAPAGPRSDGPGSAGGAGPGGGASEGDGDAGGDAGGGDDGPTVRGVTDDTIKIGIGVPDAGAFGAASDQFDLGDGQEQMEAILDRWKREGVVPIHGRDVEFVYREYGIVGGDEQVAACNGFVKDDEVFMVVAIRNFEDGVDCVADRFDTPLVTLDAMTENDLARTHPNLFTLRTVIEWTGRNWMQWADRNGLLEGKTIGIYSGTDDPASARMAELVVAELDELDHEVADHQQTSNSATGSAQESVAVQSFQQNGVDLALLLVGPLSQQNFMQNAESQAYLPTYIDTDHRDHTTDAGSSVYPPEQYAGTLAMTHKRVGEIRAGRGLTAKAEACLTNYERFSGEEVDRSSPESEEMITILVGCDEAEILLEGLRGAGRDLTHASFVDAVERIQGMESRSHGRVGFDPTTHHGVEQQRTVEWLEECTCWSALGEFEPLWVR